jgi:hypothetical protein
MIHVSPTGVVSSLSPPRCCLSSDRCRHTSFPLCCLSSERCRHAAVPCHTSLPCAKRSSLPLLHLLAMLCPVIFYLEPKLGYPPWTSQLSPSTLGTRALFLVCDSSPRLNKYSFSCYPLKAKYVELMGKEKWYNSSHVCFQAKGCSKKS